MTKKYLTPTVDTVPFELDHLIALSGSATSPEIQEDNDSPWLY